MRRATKTNNLQTLPKDGVDIGFSIGTSGVGTGSPRRTLDAYADKVEGRSFNLRVIWHLLVFRAALRFAYAGRFRRDAGGLGLDPAGALPGQGGD